MQNNRIRKTLKLFVLTGTSLLFLGLGVQMLVDAYARNDPYSFLIYFFAANFVILISATLAFGFVCHLWRLARPARPEASRDARPDGTEPD